MAKEKKIEKKEKKDSKESKNLFLDYYKKYYKKLLFIPIFMLLISIFFIYQAISDEGTPIYRDISLKGGLSSILNIETNIASNELQNQLESDFRENSFAVSEVFEDGKKSGFIVDTDLEEEKFLEYISAYFETDFIFGENYTSNFISPTLSSAFFKQAVFILLISFILMSIVVFLYFKKLVPSGALIISAIFDLIVTIGVLNMMEFKISIAGIGALLMLIGYSIDTDVLLTNRLVKEFGGDNFEKVFDAFKTGMLMTLTTLAAGVIALILTNSSVIYEICLILVIGLIVDFFSTWFQNTAILLTWLENKK